MSRAFFIAVCCALVGFAVGCRGKEHASGGSLSLGTQVAGAQATDLRVTHDGEWALYLSNVQKPRLQGVPPQMILGELHAVSLTGGSPRKLGNGVTNVPGGYLVSADSRWVLFLTGYNAANQAGELKALDLKAPAADPVPVGTEVTYMLISPDSKWLAFVSNGVLKVGKLEGADFHPVAGEVESARFSPDSSLLLYKRTLNAAGSLLVQKLGQAESAKKLGDQVGELQVSPDSKRVAFESRSETIHSTYDLFLANAPDFKPLKVATGTGGFQFSPDGKWLARTEGQRPEVLGDLYVGPPDGSAGRKAGEKVQEFSFAPDSTAIAALELYDLPSRSGLMTVTSLPDGKPKRVGSRVPNFEWGEDGRSVAFLQRFVKPIFSVDLMLYTLGADVATKVNPGVFGYSFGPKNEFLLFRSNCIRNGRACDLFELPLKSTGAVAKKLIDGIYSWRTSDDGQRILVTYARMDQDAYDIAVYNRKSAERKTIDRLVTPPAVFTGTGGSQVVYIEQERARAGVYLAQKLP